MHGLGLRHTSKPKKSARVVGDTLGLYHPHGDAACYGALVGLANTNPTVVYGQGNWGSPVDPAAAQRYTECRLSKFADLFLLEPGYLKVVQHEPNYDDTTTLPLHLPSTIPTLLLIGNEGGIAYGVRACNPSFEFEGVAKLTAKVLKGKKLTLEDICDNLVIQAPFGSRCVSTPEQLRDFFHSGSAVLKYAPLINVDYNKRIVEIKSYAPGFASISQIEKHAVKISAFPEVSKWTSDCGKKRKHAGPHGCYYYVTPKRGISDEDLHELAQRIEAQLTGSEYYALGITIRRLDKTGFSYCNYEKFLTAWAQYRLKLEIAYLHSLISIAEGDLDKLELLLYAVKNRKQILIALQKALEAPNPDQYLAKVLKIDLVKATAILNLQVRKLAKLEQSDLEEKITEVKARIKQYRLDLKDPAPRTVSHLTKTVNTFMKAGKTKSDEPEVDSVDDDSED